MQDRIVLRSIRSPPDDKRPRHADLGEAVFDEVRFQSHGDVERNVLFAQAHFSDRAQIRSAVPGVDHDLVDSQIEHAAERHVPAPLEALEFGDIGSASRHRLRQRSTMKSGVRDVHRRRRCGRRGRSPSVPAVDQEPHGASHRVKDQSLQPEGSVPPQGRAAATAADGKVLLKHAAEDFAAFVHILLPERVGPIQAKSLSLPSPFSNFYAMPDLLLFRLFSMDKQKTVPNP